MMQDIADENILCALVIADEITRLTINLKTINYRDVCLQKEEKKFENKQKRFRWFILHSESRTGKK